MHNRTGQTSVRLRILIIPASLLIIFFAWWPLRLRPVFPATLTPEARADIVRKLGQLRPEPLQVEKASNGLPALYALGSPGRLPRSVLVNGRMPNGSTRIYLFSLRWRDSKAMPGLPYKDVGITSGTSDHDLFVKSPYAFYFSSQAGQVQTLIAWNLASGKHQQFVFPAPIRSATISDSAGNGNYVLVVCNTVAGKRQNISLRLLANEVTAGSNELKPIYAGSNNDTLFIRLVEWVRDYIGSAVVAGIENTYYVARDFWTYHTYHLTHPGVTADPLPSSGINRLKWVTLVHGSGGKPVLESTTLSPDPDRPYAKVNLVRIDPQAVRFHLVAGTQEPAAATRIHGDGVIPVDPAIRMRVIAAFNGGFKTKDGQYGVIIDGITYVPPKTSLATFILYADGNVDVRSWGSEMHTSSPIVSLRQNLPLILDNAVLNPLIQNRRAWGATVGNATYVWRSGLGITTGNKIIYAAGNDLSAYTLARALQAAGCIRAMEMDINSYWVSFNIYRWNSSRSYLAGRKLAPEMHRPETRYLTTDTRDFFYLTLK